LFNIDKCVGIDICQPVAEFDAFCAQHPIGRKIKTHYGVCQTDRVSIRKIIDLEFGDRPLDVVIDDASHLYAQTRLTFECAFPRLKPGGLYVIEDWGWAHWPESRTFMGRSALSILIMELVMLCASRSDVVSEVRVFPEFALIRKSPQAQNAEDMDLDSLYTKRGLEIVSADRANLAGIARVFTQRLQLRLTDKMRSVAKRIAPNAWRA
jgi:SAM-dependent methyltransferase